MCHLFYEFRQTEEIIYLQYFTNRAGKVPAFKREISAFGMFQMVSDSTEMVKVCGQKNTG
jgi:hypothetical protein